MQFRDPPRPADSATRPHFEPVRRRGSLRGADWSLTGGNQVRLLSGGDELFPAMAEAIAQAQQRVLLASYIFHSDTAGQQLAQALAGAARRGVWVGVVVDGFGSKASLDQLRQWLVAAGVRLAVFRPVDRWWQVLQPGQLRRLHQKLCVVDGALAFVGGINIIDDRNDLHHGYSDTPRLDFAVALRGPVVAAVERSARAIWTRAGLRATWRTELRQILQSSEPVARARQVLANLRSRDRSATTTDAQALPPVRVAFIVRDNLRNRRAIEHAYVQAMVSARSRIDVICPYFYPGRLFRRALRRAARRGVRVRLLLQGKLDYRLAGMAAQVLYDELLASGVELYEYMPAFLHAKVALVDDHWATVGSSNIDPLSLLLNLEANAVISDSGFAADLSRRFDAAVALSAPVNHMRHDPGWLGILRRGLVASVAYWFLKLAGWNGRY